MRLLGRSLLDVAILVPVRRHRTSRLTVDTPVVFDSLRHQKNLAGTRSVSPGSTGSPSLAPISFLTPSINRTILMRVVDPRSVIPPASDNTCTTVEPRWMRYA